LNERLFLPQIVHCRLLVAGLHSRYGSSGGCQSWSRRLHCMPGACRGLEQLPHCALSTESRNPQRATIGVDERRAASKGASQDMVFIVPRAYGNAVVHRRQRPHVLGSGQGADPSDHASVWGLFKSLRKNSPSMAAYSAGTRSECSRGLATKPCP
jgi:hypothetical protein